MKAVGGETEANYFVLQNGRTTTVTRAPIVSESSQTSATAAATGSPHPIQNPIRHAGRALVRGKFRRVWRPRHLEVLDNGVVKYYEVPPPTPGATSTGITLDAFNMENTAASGGDYNTSTTSYEDHSKIPKATLWIHHARIIDVTTLRDMHVGLPRGSFGFLFHGHQLIMDDYDDEDMARMENDTDLLRENIQLLAMGHACQGNAIVATSRDFLCAVSSLEEAQSWVIALQWAASMGRESSFHIGSSGTGTGTGLPYSPSRDVSWQDDALSISSSFTQSQTDVSSPKSNAKRSAVSASPATTTRPCSIQPKPSQLSSATATTKTTTATSTTTATTGRKATPNHNNTGAGKMVVTKVVGYQWVRLEFSQWEIAYQIQVLLVMPTPQQRQVQEWAILRTAHDLERLLDKLKVNDHKSTSNSPNSNNQKLSSKLNQQTGRITSLPQVQSSSGRQLKLSDVSKAVSTVDNIMRFFCMEATLVNSSAMKRFLGLHPSSIIHRSASSFWAFHEPTALATQRKRTILHQSIDQYVKQWLQQSKQQTQSTTLRSQVQFQLMCWYLRLPQPSTTYAGILLLSVWLSSSILPSLNRFIRKYQVIPFVAVRLDALILSWCVAAALGHWRAVGHRQLPASTERRHAMKTASPVVSTTSTNKYPTASKGDVLSQEEKRAASLQSKSLMDADADADSDDQVIDEHDDGDDEEEEEDGEEHVEINTAAASKDEAPSSTSSFLLQAQDSRLSSPLPQYDRARNVKESCWSKPKDRIFNVRGPTYLADRVKVPSAKASFTCQGVDMWMTDNPERHIARHPSVLGGRLATTKEDIFLVNFLLPFGNFVSYFSVPPLDQFATPQLADVWTRFIQGDQQYRDARLKLLPVVVDGPWIVRAAVPGNSPALLGKVIPLQYFFTQKENGRSIYEVDVIITASSIAKGILSVVKGHAKALSIAFAFIIEAADEKELPETALAAFQVNALHLEDCPLLPICNLDAITNW